MVNVPVIKVAVEQTAFHFDKSYTYRVSEEFSEIKRGCRVLVPFGKGNHYRQGIVLFCEQVPLSQAKSLKTMVSLLDEEPLLSEELLSLALWLKERTFCTVFDAVRAMLPTGLYWNIKPVYTPVIPLEDAQREKMTPDEASIYAFLCQAIRRSSSGVTADKILRLAGIEENFALLDNMAKKGWLVRSEDTFRHANDATRRMVQLAVLPEDLPEAMLRTKCTPKQKTILSLLLEAGAASVKEICYLAGVTQTVISTLQNKGLITCFEQEVLRSPLRCAGKKTVFSAKLSSQQKRAYDELVARYEEPKAACALLYGVTGSGKTQVYMNLIDHVLADKKQVLVLVPEISLTPQTLELFLQRYGERVAVLHSGLSVGERMDEWKRIRRGQADVVVGTRSAVFAPLDSLGLIVMDEEQEHTYKSENSPRYHARDVAKFRCMQHNALLVLASATPSVESYDAACKGKYSLHTLSARYGEAALPTVNIVDMRDQLAESTVFSTELQSELQNCLDNKQQAILLLNRRGYHTFVSCRTCGHILSCPSCSISMTHHRANNRLVCHYCGHMQPMITRCPECGADTLRYSGLGTQRVEEETKVLFPKARILRMDTDSAMSRSSYEEKFKAFSEGKYDVMIGTQMVAKGLDFPNVSLVGVLSADQALFSEDYRSYETTFSLLTQVVGRAGRRKLAGKAVIQTTVPEHYVIDLASKQDYQTFYEVEITSRKMMKYPPYSDLCMFGFVSISELAVKNGAQQFLQLLKETVALPEYEGLPLIALNPTPATVLRVAGKYRYKLVVKLVNNSISRELISRLLTEFSRLPESKDVTVFADINPANIL